MDVGLGVARVALQALPGQAADDAIDDAFGETARVQFPDQFPAAVFAPGKQVQGALPD
jgi:hypothetical protein